MSDYQKLKAEYDKLKEKAKEQAFLISQMKKLLVTMLDYNNYVKSNVIGLLGIIGENDV